MSIVVNTNVSSINAQRNLTKSTNSLNKAMERLSSGLRINHSGDDAAGLAIADGMNTQITGMTQAMRNAADGMSLLGNVDGATGQQIEILQRIRELTVQAANDINSTANRTTIQNEINAQIAEITRIANTTQFNGTSLMTGSFSNKMLQVGANSGQTISLTLDDLRATALGTVATTTGTTAIDTTTTITGAGNVIINGTTIANSANYISTDNVSTVNKAGGAIAKAAAINGSFASTNVTATANAATFSYGAVVGGATTAASGLIINGVTIYDFAASGAVTFLASDTNAVLRNMINAKSNSTGVVASMNVAGTGILLTAADGRNVQVVENGNFDTVSGVTAQTFTGTLTLTSQNAIQWTAAAANVIGLAVAGNQAVDLNTAINNITVDTAANAATALLRIDSAMTKLGQAQANVGALSNRLLNTIANLQISVENMSASESRIRDADFAVETANMTRAQIIQQAGVAVLSQANVSSQSALTLLGA